MLSKSVSHLGNLFSCTIEPGLLFWLGFLQKQNLARFFTAQQKPALQQEAYAENVHSTQPG